MSFAFQDHFGLSSIDNKILLRRLDTAALPLVEDMTNIAYNGEERTWTSNLGGHTCAMVDTEVFYDQTNKVAKGTCKVSLCNQYIEC